MSKVLLVNGSPKQYGCTNAALDVVAASLSWDVLVVDVAAEQSVVGMTRIP